METKLTPDQIDIRTLQSMIDGMVGIPKFTYPARQNSAGLNQKKPSGEFAHIRILTESAVGIPSTYILSQTELTTTTITYSPVKLRVRIGVVDTTGIPSSKILGGWNSEEMKALMIKTGYGFIKCEPISSEDAKLEKEWEYRRGFSLEIYVTRSYQETINNINKVIIKGNFIEFKR